MGCSAWSGCPVVVSEDTSLKTLAAARIARGANKMHLISFNASAVGEPDYFICFQCGFILRLFSIAAADRFDFAGTVEELDFISSTKLRAGNYDIKYRLGETWSMKRINWREVRI